MAGDRGLHPSGHLTFLVTQYERAVFKAAGFTARFVEWAKEAGLERSARPHGLRKSIGRRLAEAGADSSDADHAAILGHREPRLRFETYTRDVDQKRLADKAMDAPERGEVRANREQEVSNRGVPRLSNLIEKRLYRLRQCSKRSRGSP